MILMILCLLTLQCQAFAGSTRTVHLSDGDLEPVYVEPGFSTLIKFDSHPEPGLIGDQDGFKVEYMKNMVAIKPLVSKGKTNLFLFTKEGQFNFQLVANKGRHDNVVYVQAGSGHGLHPSTAKVATLVDDLITRRLNKVATAGTTKLVLESVATPVSHSTLVLKCLIEDKSTTATIDPTMFSVTQASKVIKIENVFLDMKKDGSGPSRTSALILIRADQLKSGKVAKLSFTPKSADSKRSLQVLFTPELGRR